MLQRNKRIDRRQRGQKGKILEGILYRLLLVYSANGEHKNCSYMKMRNYYGKAHCRTNKK